MISNSDKFILPNSDKFILPSSDKFILSERESIIKYGIDSKNIGNGSCGKVYECLSGADCKKYAVKVFIDELYNQVSEIAILKNLNHPYIIKPLCINLDYSLSCNSFGPNDMHEDEHMHDFMIPRMRMYMEKADMAYIDIPEQRKHIYKQILEAINYCHTNNVWHTDIKPQNILMFFTSSAVTIKLADFSSAIACAHVSDKNTLNIQTLYYRSPEIFLDYELYDEKIDIWSIGVMLFNDVTKSDILLSGDGSHDQLNNIMNLIGYPYGWIDYINEHNTEQIEFKKLRRFDRDIKKQKKIILSKYDRCESDIICKML